MPNWTLNDTLVAAWNTEDYMTHCMDDAWQTGQWMTQWTLHKTLSVSLQTGRCLSHWVFLDKLDNVWPIECFMIHEHYMAHWELNKKNGRYMTHRTQHGTLSSAKYTEQYMTRFTDKPWTQQTLDTTNPGQYKLWTRQTLDKTNWERLYLVHIIWRVFHKLGCAFQSFRRYFRKTSVTFLPLQPYILGGIRWLQILLIYLKGTVSREFLP
jgi:hypothetical protein